MKKLLLGFLFLTQWAYGQEKYTGVATHFEALGTPYGGCGVPPDLVETEYFVALNVYHSPGVGTSWPRPLTGADTVYMGEFKNGRNCGRWVRVSIMEDCIGGTNDGALGQEFCRGGNAQWTHDKYSYAVLNMIVTDACGDNNGWCRDSRYHLDLHTSSLNNFEKDGQKVADMLPAHFNNRKIEWEYIKAPNYTGDIDIYFMQNSQQYWASVLIGHLENGIHDVEQKVGGEWVKLKTNSDMGQAYLLDPSEQPYRIRVWDADDKLINNGREYIFSLPASCGGRCPVPATKASYQTYDPVVTSVNDAYQDRFFYVGGANDNYQVLWELDEMVTSIHLVDVLGRTIKDFKVNAFKGSLDPGSLTEGYYRVVFYGKNTILGSKALIK
jgi:hypothetical protein